MVFRNCMSFGPYRPWNRPPAPTIINRNFYVNPQPYGCYNSCGSNAFWGGFVGGILSGGLNFLGRMFGPQNYGATSMYSPMTTYYSPYSMLNQNAERLPEGSSELKILEKHYGEKYNISESGGKFYATPKDQSGKTIIANSYEEMLRLLGGETPDPRADEIKATRLAKEKEDFNANEQVREKGASIKVIGLEGEETTTEETNDNRYKFELTYQDANGNPKVEVVDTITDAYEILGLLDPTEGTDDGQTAARTEGSDDGQAAARAEGSDDGQTAARAEGLNNNKATLRNETPASTIPREIQNEINKFNAKYKNKGYTLDYVMSGDNAKKYELTDSNGNKKYLSNTTAVYNELSPQWTVKSAKPNTWFEDDAILQSRNGAEYNLIVEDRTIKFSDIEVSGNSADDTNILLNNNYDNATIYLVNKDGSGDKIAVERDISGKMYIIQPNQNGKTIRTKIEDFLNN